MNNKYHPKTISGILIIKVVAITITREAFVLHKILFCDHRKLLGRSRAAPDTSALPHWCQVMVTYQHNINLHTWSVICFSKSFRIPSSELFTSSLIVFRRTFTMNHPDHLFFPLRKCICPSRLTTSLLFTSSCPAST